MQQQKTRNIALIAGLAIPLLMMLFIGLAIQAPGWFSDTTPPRHDFLYSIGPYETHDHYQVVAGRLRKSAADPAGDQDLSREQRPHFFIHEVKINRSREIDEAEALRLRLDARLRSPDGFTLESGYRGGWFPFFYRDDSNSRYLVRDNYRYKLDLESGDRNYSYYWGLRFHGWIQP